MGVWNGERSRSDGFKERNGRLIRGASVERECQLHAEHEQGSDGHAECGLHHIVRFLKHNGLWYSHHNQHPVSHRHCRSDIDKRLLVANKHIDEPHRTRNHRGWRR